MAALTDKLDRVTDSTTGRPIVASLAAPGHSIAGTTFNLAAATNWSTVAKLHFSVYATTTISTGAGTVTIKDSTTQTDWEGTLSGTTLTTSGTPTGGTDRAYSAGAIVEITPTAKYAKDLYDWATAQHNQDGTHGAVTASNLTTTGAVTAGNGLTVSTGAIVVPNNTAFIVPANLTASTGTTWAWQSYTPTWTASTVNPTLGNGVLTASYMQIGKTVHFRIRIVLGTTSSAGTGVWSFSLPVTSAASYAANDTLGTSRIEDTGVATALGICTWATTTTCRIWANTTTKDWSLASVAFPYAVANTDIISLSGTYEAA